VAVAAARSVRRTVLLPVADQRIFDVGHKSVQPALHEIVCLSSVGFSSRIRRRVAYFLWLWRHSGCVLHGSHVKRMDAVDISKEVFALADSIPASITPNPLRDRACTQLCRWRFFLQASPGSTTLSLASHLRPKMLGSVNLYTQEFFR